MAEREWPTAQVALTDRDYLVERLTEPQEVARLLEGDPLYAAYALGQLEPPFFAKSEWWLAQGPGGQALLMHSWGGLGNTLFALGDSEALAAALALHPGPLFTFIMGLPHHLPSLQRFYYLRQGRPFLRMAVDAESFRHPGGRTWRLGVEDLARVNRLYASDGEPSYIRSRHLQEGIYYGIEEDGELVAIAGTHAIAPSYGVAVVGNVFTHPKYRGRGYATIATGAVTAELLKSCHHVVLTVDAQNRPAVAAYRHLGYREEGQILETGAIRRPGTILSGPRRLLARLRGRPYGAEVIRLR